jgi:hypothetical protein
MRAAVARTAATSRTEEVIAHLPRYVGHRRPARVAHGLAIVRRLLDEQDYPLELGGIECPVMFVWGDRDRAAVWPRTGERLRRLAGRAPNARQEVLAGIGHAAQLAIVERQVNDALAMGARAIVGGNRSELGGTFFEPTVLVNVDHTLELMRDESFGPVLPVMKVTDAEEAIQLANDSPFGLSATIWTADAARGRQIARRLEVGVVNINDAFTNIFTFPVPHSGWKQSGIGSKLGGAAGIRKYRRAQAVTETRIAPSSELLWYPYTAGKGRIAGRILRFLTARDLRRRLRRG